ncbi:hypothetical protein K438DRAFT_593490 [Mycena galopus ATCC 62051]|nr:hypothetical protein K438DRAFT_593490 [Mycena galopus ATCC 62051]
MSHNLELHFGILYSMAWPCLSSSACCHHFLLSSKLNTGDGVGEFTCLARPAKKSGKPSPGHGRLTNQDKVHNTKTSTDHQVSL